MLVILTAISHSKLAPEKLKVLWLVLGGRDYSLILDAVAIACDSCSHWLDPRDEVYCPKHLSNRTLHLYDGGES